MPKSACRGEESNLTEYPNGAHVVPSAFAEACQIQGKFIARYNSATELPRAGLGPARHELPHATLAGASTCNLAGIPEIPFFRLWAGGRVLARHFTFRRPESNRQKPCSLASIPPARCYSSSASISPTQWFGPLVPAANFAI